MGQALFLVVFCVLLTVGTAWAANDLRVRGEVSELAELVLRLLAVLGSGVFILAASSSAWASDVPILVRLPLGVVLAVIGLLSAVRAGHPAIPGGGHLIANPVHEGLLLLGVAAAVIADSPVALLLVAIAGVVVRVLAAADADGAGTVRDDEPHRGERWASRPAFESPTDVE